MHQMARQTEQAIDEADVVIFVVDGRSGVTALDKEIANRLRKSGRPVLVAVNKAEGMSPRGRRSPISMNWVSASRWRSRRHTAKACGR
jgi:predicted GTPase